MVTCRSCSAPPAMDGLCPRHWLLAAIGRRATAVTVVLDWRGAQHMRQRPGPCHHCGRWTQLLDDARRPSHKVCAERAIQQKAAAAAGRRG